MADSNKHVNEYRKKRTHGQIVSSMRKAWIEVFTIRNERCSPMVFRSGWFYYSILSSSLEHSEKWHYGGLSEQCEWALSMRDSRGECPQEDSRWVASGQIRANQWEVCSSVVRKRSSRSSGGVSLVMIHLKFVPKWLPQNKQHIKPLVPRVCTPPSFGSGWMPPLMVGGQFKGKWSEGRWLDGLMGMMMWLME